MKTEAFWNQLLEHGSEHLALQQGNIIEADGLAVGVVNGTAYRVRYQVLCDTGWNVYKVRVEDLLNNKEIYLLKNENKAWTDENDQPFEELSGCSDVDIMVTPFTNTLPIRRLNLILHESREISVMYVRIPDLNVSNLKQRYTYLADGRDGRIYKYENLNSGFTSDLTVDADGLAIDYPGIFKMVWKKDESDTTV